MDKSIIDISKLENCKSQPDGSTIAACPCCREQGNDKAGNHLRVWPNHAFNCIVGGDDSSHNKRILQLVGTNVDINSTDYIAPQKQEPRVTMEKDWDISLLSSLIRNHDYWNKRNISSETCDFFRMGIAYKGQMNQRTILPIINKNNPSKIIGFSGRALKEDMKPKWKHLGAKSDFLIPAIDEEIIKAKSVILVESPGCFLSLFDNNIKNTICLFGVTISGKVMAYLIRMNPERILIATNNELDSSNGGVGNLAAKKISKQLSQFFNADRIKIALPTAKDFNLMTPEMIKQYRHDHSL